MGQVFGCCYALIIYLGDGDPNHYEQQLFDSVNFSYHNSELVPFTADTLLPTPNIDKKTFIEFHRTAIQNLLDRPWFKRLWVVQEFLRGYGNRTRVVIGALSLIGRAVRYLVEDVMTYGLSFSLSAPSYLTEFTSATTILEFIQQCNDLRCSDDRDRVHALQGVHMLLSPKIDECLVINPDYSRSVADLYHDFACQRAEAGEVVPLLTCAFSRRRSGPYESPNWPSWVPD